jgi:hypothetical protein
MLCEQCGKQLVQGISLTSWPSTNSVAMSHAEKLLLLLLLLMWLWNVLQFLAEVRCWLLC